MMPVPQIIADDLCNTLLHLMEDDAELSPFERHKYASQAEKLKRADPAGREAALMLLAVLNDDPAACLEHGETLLDLRGNETDYNNFAAILSNMEQMAEMFSVLQRGVKKYPQSIVLLDNLISTAIAFEDAVTLEKALEQWNVLTDSPHPSVIDTALQEMGEEESLKVLSELFKHNLKENVVAPSAREIRNMRKLADEIES